MTLGVVDRLQTVDIDEGDDELGGGSPCSIYLLSELLHAGTPPPDVGQLIRLRRFAVQGGLSAILRRHGAVVGRMSAFFGCATAIVRRPGAIGRRLLAVVRCSEDLILAPCRSR